MEIGSVDIAAMSVQMKQAQVAEQVDIAVMKNQMDFSEEIAGMLIEQLTQVNVSAASGHVDIGA